MIQLSTEHDFTFCCIMELNFLRAHSQTSYQLSTAVKAEALYYKRIALHIYYIAICFEINKSMWQLRKISASCWRRYIRQACLSNLVKILKMIAIALHCILLNKMINITLKALMFIWQAGITLPHHWSHTAVRAGSGESTRRSATHWSSPLLVSRISKHRYRKLN